MLKILRGRAAALIVSRTFPSRPSLAPRLLLAQYSSSSSETPTPEDFKKFLEDNDKIGLKNLVQIFGKTRNKAARHIEVKKKIEEMGPTAENYHKLLLNYSSACNVEMAEEAFEVMKEDPSRMLSPMLTYCGLLAAYCNSGKMDKAQEFVENMDKIGLSGYTPYALLINGYANSNQDEHALKTLEKAEQLGIKPGKEMRDAVLRVLVRKGQTTKALEVSNALQSKYQIPQDHDSLHLAVSGLTSADDVAGALDYVREAKEKGVRAQPRTYEALIRRIGRTDAEKAYQLLQQMKKDGTAPDVYTYNALMDVYDKKNLVDKAYALLEEMKAEGMEGNGATYGHLEALATRNKRSDLFKKETGDVFYIKRPDPL